MSPAPNVSGRSGRSRGRSSSKVYNSRSYKTRLLASAANRHVWGVDSNEVDWAKANLQKILNQDFQVTPHGSGGLKITSVRAGSIGSARGIVAGDIVKSINGRPLKSMADLKTLMTGSRGRSSNLSLTLERAGKSMVIEYRPLPKSKSRRGR